jgi:hypothetical protein
LVQSRGRSVLDKVVNRLICTISLYFSAGTTLWKTRELSDITNSPEVLHYPGCVRILREMC